MCQSMTLKPIELCFLSLRAIYCGFDLYSNDQHLPDPDSFRMQLVRVANEVWCSIFCFGEIVLRLRIDRYVRL